MSLAILCSGQGAQHPAMLDMIADHQAASEIIKTGEAELGFKLREVLTQSDKIFRNAIAQPLICLAQLALWTALRQDAPKPAAFCGYSVGELGAYACAGALDAAGLARIAAARAALMDKAAAATHGGMLASQGLRRNEVEQLCEGLRAWIAIAIGEDEFVIGGEDSALTRLGKEISERGAKLTRLKVGVASHTPLLSIAVEPFRAAARCLIHHCTCHTGGRRHRCRMGGAPRYRDREAGAATGSHDQVGELPGHVVRTRMPGVPGTRAGARAGAHDAGALWRCRRQVGG